MRFTLQKRYKIPSLSWKIFIVITFIFSLFWFIELHIKPTLFAIAEVKAMTVATQAINEVIREQVVSKYNPQDLVDVKVDHQGRVSFVQPNTIEFNKLSSDTVISVQEILQKLSDEKINIPIGQLTGSQMLASVGPPITVKIIPMGTVDVKVINEFNDAGINQTKHTLSLKVITKIKIVVPLISKEISVETTIPVAEYLVVGEVPNTYVKLPFQNQ